MANTFQIASYDPVALERNKRMAEMLMKQQGNVNNGTTLGALATALQGGLAGYASSRATQQEQARNQALAEILKQKGGTATGDYGLDQSQLAAILDPRFAYQKERDTKSDSFDREKFDYAKSTDARDFDYNKTMDAKKLALEEQRIVRAAQTESPAAVREYQYYMSLPQEQRPEYLSLKRAQQVIDLGGTKAVLNSAGDINKQYDVTPKETDTPDYKYNQELAKQKGKYQAAFEETAPGAIEGDLYMENLLDELIQHPGLSAAVGVKGPTGGLLGGKVVPGTEAADFVTMLDQIKGAQFLQAYEDLKGGGQITEVEGVKAEAAKARMNTAQSEKAFIEAATEFQSIVKKARERKQRRMGQTSTTQGGDLSSMSDEQLLKDLGL